MIVALLLLILTLCFPPQSHAGETATFSGKAHIDSPSPLHSTKRLHGTVSESPSNRIRRPSTESLSKEVDASPDTAASAHIAPADFIKGGASNVIERASSNRIKSIINLSDLCGEYRGTLQEGSLDEVTTELQLDGNRLVGWYSVPKSPLGPYKGSLVQYGDPHDGEIDLTWSDRFGTGCLRLVFDKDNSHFAGYWSHGNSRLGLAEQSWNGEKVKVTESNNLDVHGQ